MADLKTSNSTYASGTIDTATLVVAEVDEMMAQQINGALTAAVGIQTTLGDSTTLKGAFTNLATRLANLLNSSGQLLFTGFQGLVADRGLLATSATTMTVVNHTPIGLITQWPAVTVPVHWLLCEGQAVSRTTYSKLFTAIGTVYGAGDSSTTFNLPELRGRVIVGIDTAGTRISAASTNGANAANLAGIGGAQTHTLTTAQIPVHQHGMQGHVSDGAGAGGHGGFEVGASANSSESDLATDNEGSGQAHSTTPPWIAMYYIIFAAQ